MNPPDDLSELFFNPVVAFSKLTYLLDSEKTGASGESKAKFFNMHGYDMTNHAEFVKAIKAYPCTAKPERVFTPTAWGLKFEFVCDFHTPSAAGVCIRSIWQLDRGGTTPRLITAYPNDVC